MFRQVTDALVRAAAPRVLRDPVLAVSEARRIFFGRDRVPSGLVSERVLASWQRCRALGLDPAQRPAPDALRRDELGLLRERNAILLRAATPVLRTIAAHIDGDPNLVLLTDAAGVILSVEGNREFAICARRRDLRPGLVLRESARGTNAPGACVQEAGPLVVHGAEHYLAMYSIFTCSAAPIHGPDGEMAGVIDITGDARALPPYPVTLPRMAATLIEQQLIRLSYPRHALLRFHRRPEYLGAIGEGIAVLAEDGRVLGINTAGLGLLGLAGSEVRGKPLDEVVDARVAELRGPARGALQRVVRLQARGGARFYARLEDAGRANSVSTESGAQAVQPADAGHALRQVENAAVQRALAAERGNVSAAARRLGIARTTLYRKLGRLGVADCRDSRQRRAAR